MIAERNFQAALLAMTASGILSFIDNFVAPVAEESGLWQFQAIRSLFAIPLLILFARIAGKPWWIVNFRATAIRSMTVSTGLLIYFGTLGFMPVAQAGAGVFTAPIWVLLFSALLFGARVTRIQAFAIPFGFIGVLLMLQPDFGSLNALTAMPLLAGVLYGLGMLLTRHLCAEESAIGLSIGIFAAMGIVGVVLLIFFTIWPAEMPSFAARGWEPVTERFVWLTLFQGVGAVIAVTLLAQAYRVGDASYVAVFEYSFLIFACLWAFLLRGDGVGALTVLGIAIIVVSGTVMSLFHARQQT